ncbi:Uncharacterized protein APZ42_031842 [Daphnia magna]|uniref:Uncharacterized protein n=1 Tax=Daphnia magna TaxID=35525 RepID=A0A164MHK8_9CRUS|nr:Uncharacterized protein APZ42_031842 [Daphnia magna]
MCQHVRRPECRVGPGEMHSHRNPTVHEMRYLSLRYKVRIFCAERRSVAGIQYYIRELIQRYNLPWSQRDVYRSVWDVAPLCAHSRRVWRRTVPWNSPDSPERAAYLRRQEAGRARRAAQRLVFDERRDVVCAPTSPVMLVVGDPAAPPGSPVLEPDYGYDVPFINILHPPEVLEAARLVVGCRVSFSSIQNALHRVQRWFKERTDGIRRSPLPEEVKIGVGQWNQILERAVGDLEQLGIVRERYERLQGVLIRKTIRPKRGLLDAGGSVLNWLFGVAMDKSLEGLNDHLEALTKKTPGIVHAMSQQAKLVNYESCRTMRWP